MDKLIDSIKLAKPGVPSEFRYEIVGLGDTVMIRRVKYSMFNKRLIM